MPALVIVDDSAVLRDAIKTLLSLSLPAWKVCGEAGDQREAVRQCEELRPDAVLVDLSLPGTSGIAVAQALKERIPAAKIVIMSAQDPDVLSSVTRACGFECVGKSQLATDLPAILARAATGAPQDSDTRD
jgi:DNA-binding NarL/FixJ family response regulator